MSLASPLRRPAALRPYLSPRYVFQHAPRRAQSTSAAPPPPPPRRRNRARLAFCSVGIAFGLMGGFTVTHFIAPPALPLPGSHGDKILVADLDKSIDEEFKVKVLRGKCLGVAKQLKGEQGGWVELVRDTATTTTANPYMNQTAAGFRALGVERVFYNRAENTVVAVIWLGGDLSGWPGVAHGGMLATQLQEKLGLVSLLSSSEYDFNAVAAAVPQRLPGTGNHAKMPFPARDSIHEPRDVSISYVKPTYANAFYVVRAGPSTMQEIREDPKNIVPGEPSWKGHEFEGTIETMDARICVKAKASFVQSGVGERVKGALKEVADGGKGSYEQFKGWLWPSRQAGGST